MSRLKQGGKIAGMFLLLFAIALGPLFFLGQRTRDLIGKVTVKEVQAARLEKKQSERVQNLWEQIEAVREDGTTILAPAEKLTSHDGLQGTDEIMETMEQQLSLLGSCHGLPALSCSGRQQESVYQEIYMDRTETADLGEPGRTLSVWAIYAEYDDFFLYAFMDTETGALYELDLTAKKEDFLYQREDISADSFLEYLQSFCPIPEDLDRQFSAHCVYTGRKISLYLVSMDKGKSVDETASQSVPVFCDDNCEWENQYRFYHPKMREEESTPLYRVMESNN